MAKCKHDYAPGEPVPRTCPMHGLNCPPLVPVTPENIHAGNPKVTVAKVQLEMSESWVRANPIFAVKTVTDFVTKHRGMNIVVYDGASGTLNTIILVAYTDGESPEVEV